MTICFATYQLAFEEIRNYSSDEFVCSMEKVQQWVKKYEHWFIEDECPLPIPNSAVYLPNYYQFHSFYSDAKNIVQYYRFKQDCIEALEKLESTNLEKWKIKYSALFEELFDLIIFYWDYFPDFNSFEDRLYINERPILGDIRIKLKIDEFEEIIQFTSFYFSNCLS